jgi:glycosyltransferase involved in cell wall biosynthesis
MPRIVVSVSNDLVTDQRVYKVCNTLYNDGYDILLIGRRFSNSLEIKRPYKVNRIKLVFRKKIWFYAEFNIRLFFKLLFTKKDILLANDLDTLLPNFIISKVFNIKLVYDSHELFTEVPELTRRPKIRKIWILIEKWIFPKLKNVITVNDAIAQIYKEKYNVPVEVIRNISPQLTSQEIDKNWEIKVKEGCKMLIIQGSGINKERGAEEAVEMMQYLHRVVLIIVGSGDVIEDLKWMIKNLKLEKKVKIIGKLPYDELLKYTQIADLGLSLDKGTNLNYELSLPNKIFDFVQCQVPIMASSRKLVAEFIESNQIGMVFDDHDPKKMAETVNSIFQNKERYDVWKDNLKQVAKIYNWESESKPLMDIYKNLS